MKEQPVKKEQAHAETQLEELQDRSQEPPTVDLHGRSQESIRELQQGKMNRDEELPGK